MSYCHRLKHSISLVQQRFTNARLPTSLKLFHNSNRAAATTEERKIGNLRSFLDHLLFPIRAAPYPSSLDDFWPRSVHESKIIVTRIFLWLGLVLLLPTYIVDLDMPIGPSMLPTINILGDIVAIWRLSLIRKYQVGDIVQCGINVSTIQKGATAGESVVVGGRNEGSSIRYVIKRITHIEDQGSAENRQDRLVWIEGDCPEQSRDSRHYGPISESCVLGRVVMRLWPLGNAWFRPNKY